jgi:hypothetical protein
VSDIAANKTSLMITSKIQAGVIYQIRVSAYNAAGEGKQSDILSIMAATIPHAPFDVQMESQNATSIGIRWSTPDNGGTFLTTYKIFSDMNSGGASFIEIVPSTGLVNKYVIDSGITADLLYIFKV